MKYLEQRVEDLEKEVAFLKALGSKISNNIAIESKELTKSELENTTSHFNITLDKYPEIVGSWDDLTYSDSIEKKIEKDFGKIISKFKILNHEWEMDGYGYVIYNGYFRDLVITDHGKVKIVDKDYLHNKVSEYKETIQETQRALSLIE
jgi:hypothetical protein